VNTNNKYRRPQSLSSTIETKDKHYGRYNIKLSIGDFLRFKSITI